MEVRFRRVDSPDHASTRKLVYDAFRSTGSEETAAFLDALRAEGCILGEWLSEDPSGPLGHIVFSRVWLEQPNGDRLKAAMLTPPPVPPDRQPPGTGLRPVDHALKEME